MIMWIARDEDGCLALYEKQPIRETSWFLADNFDSYNSRFDISDDNDEFKDVTWENSPQEISVKLLNNINKK